MPTLPYECNDSEWTAVSAGEENVLIQLQTNGPVRLQKGPGVPDVEDLTGIVLERSGGSDTVSFVKTEGEIISIRAIDSDKEEVVVIT